MNQFQKNEQQSPYLPFGSDLANVGSNANGDIRGVATVFWPNDADAFLGQGCGASNRKISVMELSGETYKMTGEIPLTHALNGPKTAFSHDSRFLYVVGRSPHSAGTELYEIDLRSPFRIARLLQLPEGRFEGVAVHCASNRIFLSDSANRTIWVVNRSYFTIQWRIGLEDGEPGCLAMSPAGDVLYVLSLNGRTLWVIDPNGNRILGSLTNLDQGHVDAESLADGSRMFISHWHEDGGFCVARVLARPSAARAKARMFAVDHKGNCRISRRTLAAGIAA